MGEIGYRGDGIELLIERHTELCELFDAKGANGYRDAPALIAVSGGRTTAECLADLADQALAVYESAEFERDPRIFALKIALTDAIMELAL